MRLSPFYMGGLLMVDTNTRTIQEKDILDLAWKYFQQHAQQRISFLHFFVIFSGLITTALLTTFQEKYQAHTIGISLGILLSIISFIFWKIDDRNKFLTKLGENAIKEIESKYDFITNYDNLEKLKLFSYEEERTKEVKKNGNIITRQMSHGKSYNLIFLIFFIIGIVGSLSSIYYQAQLSDKKTVESIYQENFKEINNNINNINQKMDRLSKDNIRLRKQVEALNLKLIEQKTYSTKAGN